MNMGRVEFLLLLPFVFGVGMIFLIQAFDEAGGGDFLTKLIFVLAGVGR